MTAEAARSYHHGDLREALVRTGLDLARAGGGDALGLRGVTRAVGVTPNAAYRHFADRRALVVAVAWEIQGLLAQTMRDRAACEQDPLARLRAVGLGYIAFALAEPGWFEVAFLTFDDDPETPSVVTDQEVPPPFALLLEVLDEAAVAGAITAEARELAEWACWSAVHGFADIATRGPLRAAPHEALMTLAASAVETVIAGLTAVSPPRA